MGFKKLLVHEAQLHHVQMCCNPGSIYQHMMDFPTIEKFNNTFLYPDPT